MVRENYISPCNSFFGVYFKGTCDVISVTRKTNSVTYHFYFFGGKFPKFSKFSDSMEFKVI